MEPALGTLTVRKNRNCLGNMLKQFKNNFTHNLKVAHLNLLRSIDKINSKLIDEEEQNSLIQKEIKLFCKTWSHPNICILNDDNTMEIQSWPQLEEDPWSKYTYANKPALIQSFSSQVHPYHTKNH